MSLDVRKTLGSGRLATIWTPLLGSRIPVFTLHRFAMPELDVAGHDPRVLRATLERLRRDRYALIGLDEALRCLRDGVAPPARAVVFTVDDGYVDLAGVGADIFLEYDCPATVFLSTGFVDGALWHWWDEIEHVCLNARRARLGTDLPLTTLAERRRAASVLSEHAKRLREDVKRRFIRALARGAEVELPVVPPARYRAISWAQARVLERRGLAFAPHTVSHPILARVDDLQAESEIRDSWRTLGDELARPVPILAYPNGGPDDYGPREFRLLAAAGLAGAMTTTKGYLSGRALRQTPQAWFQMPRFGFPDDPDRVCLIASGFERLANLLRRRPAAERAS